MASNGRVKSFYGRRFAVVSGHHLATDAAVQIIRAGGSLTDAMISASAVLAVVLPHTSSLGGCAMALFRDQRSGEIHALNGSGRAPKLARPVVFGSAMPQRGLLAAVTPTLVRFWARAHDQFGRLPWPELFQPAIAHAEDGCGVPEELARNLRKIDPLLASQPGFSPPLSPGGHALKRGQFFSQPALGRVLRTIATHGESGFYQGWAADALLEFVRSNGGLHSTEDFEAAQADWSQDIAGTHRNFDIHVMPPNSLGLLMLHQLALAAPGDGSAQQVRNAVRVIASLKDRIGDPSRMPSIAALVPGRNASSAGVRPEPGDTTGFVAIDNRGNAVSMLQSVAGVVNRWLARRKRQTQPRWRKNTPTKPASKRAPRFHSTLRIAPLESSRA